MPPSSCSLPDSTITIKTTNLLLSFLILLLVPQRRDGFVAAFGVVPPSTASGRIQSHKQGLFFLSAKQEQEQQQLDAGTTDANPSLSTDAESSSSSPATLRSVKFCNLSKSQQPQVLCDLLMEIGACSTSITDADVGTDQEEAIFVQGTTIITTTTTPLKDWMLHDGVSSQAVNAAAVVCGDAAVGRNIWKRCHVTAHFPLSVDLDWVLDLARETLEEDGQQRLESSAVEVVPDRDWVIHIQQGWKPIRIGGLMLRFPWHTDQDVQEQIQATSLSATDSDESKDDSAVVVELRLEGGVAFGTGEHPTTQLCLEWVEQQVQSNPKQRLMDYGSGSGVLGLAACALSLSSSKSDNDDELQAVGVDIDIDSVRIANANAATNGLSMRSYLPPSLPAHDESRSLFLQKGHHPKSASNDDNENVENDRPTLAPHLNQPIYDTCVANILAGPLVTLAPTLANLVKPRGHLGLSGILAPQANQVIQAYQSSFDNVRVEKELNGWVLITGTRKDDGDDEN